MADPIRHDDLVASTNVNESYRLATLITHVLDGEQEVPSLTAAALAFVAACAESGVEPEAVLAQVTEAAERGQIAVDPEFADEIDARFDRRH